MLLILNQCGNICCCVHLPLLRYSTAGAGHSFGSGVPSDAVQSGQQPQCTSHTESKTLDPRGGRVYIIKHLKKYHNVF